jgi:hypothetical protein
MSRWMVLSSLLLLAGCPLAHDAPTPKVCRDDSDCFTFEGEYCAGATSQQEGECRVRLDSGGVPPDAGPLPDTAPLVDAGDAASSDALLDLSLDLPGSDGDLGLGGDQGSD